MITPSIPRVIAEIGADGRLSVKRDVFVDTVEVSVDKMHDGWHLVVRSAQPDGYSRCTRVPVEFTRDGTIELAADSATPTETCTGNPCEHCEFPATGGCKCTVVTGRCNHTISHLNEEFPVILKA